MTELPVPLTAIAVMEIFDQIILEPELTGQHQALVFSQF
jgi:hypothetical protein